MSLTDSIRHCERLPRESAQPHRECLLVLRPTRRGRNARPAVTVSEPFSSDLAAGLLLKTMKKILALMMMKMRSRAPLTPSPWHMMNRMISFEAM